MTPTPEVLVELTQAWVRSGRPAQAGVPWPRAAWVDAFPDDAEVFHGLSELVARSSVREACRDAGVDPAGARRAFLASMAWGYGRVGYGRYRTGEALANTHDAVGKLHEVAQCLAVDGALTAYGMLGSSHRVRGLGPAFGTKFLYFCPQAEVGHPALILDQVVATWLKTYAAETVNPVLWSTRRYQWNLNLLCIWADQLAVTPEAVEERIFVSAASGQWSAT